MIAIISRFTLLAAVALSHGAQAAVPARIQSTFADVRLAGSMAEATVNYGGRGRQYHYYLPKPFSLREKHPIIILLHGFNEPIAALMADYSTITAKADRDGVILIFPIATGSLESKSLSWNTKYGTFANTSFPETDGVDDIGFLSHLIEGFLKELHGDEDRVYVTGESMGGAMTYTLACYIPDKLAAIAPVIMQMGPKLVDSCARAKSLPIMVITGTADPLVPSSGVPDGPAKGMIQVMSTEDNIRYWKARNKITSKEVVTALDDPVTEVFKGVAAPSHIIKHAWAGPQGSDLIWLEVVNGGHFLPVFDPVHPGGPSFQGMDLSFLGNRNCDYDAATGIYDFLLAHKRR